MNMKKTLWGLCAALLGASFIAGCTVDADDDPDTVVTSPAPNVTIEDKRPDSTVNIHTEPPVSTTTTGG